MGTPCVSPREACPEDTHVSLPPPLRIRACPQDTWLLTTKMGLPGAPPPVSDVYLAVRVPVRRRRAALRVRRATRAWYVEGHFLWISFLAIDVTPPLEREVGRGGALARRALDTACVLG